MKRPLSSARENASFSSGMSGAYCALTSTRGIGGTTAHRRGASPTKDEVCDTGNNREHDQDLDVAERVVDVVPARTGGVADPREEERPDRAAGQRKDRVARQRRLEGTGRDRDERARDRRQPPDEHRPVVPAGEPAFGAIEPRRTQVEPAPAPLEERPAAVEPDRP